MKALIKNNEIVQVSEESFETHPDYFWIDCPIDCTPEWIYKDGILEEPRKIFKTNQEIRMELLPSHDAMIKALWKYIVNKDSKDAEELDKKIKQIFKDYPEDN